jgi:FkbM family methyltransferase
MDIVRTADRLLRGIGLRSLAGAIFRAYVRRYPVHTCSRRGIVYELDLTKIIDRAVYLGGWEPQTAEFLRRSIDPGDVIVEVGANIGVHTLLLADLVGPSGSVIAFEPTVYAQRKLAANIALNRRLQTRISVRPELVTNHELATPNLSIQSSFPVGERYLVGERYAAGNPVGETVAARPMALDELSPARLDLLKIDVDGYDYKVLQGAARLLKSLKPIVLVELCEYTLRSQGDCIRDIFSLLSSLGYVAFYENGRPIESVEKVLELVGMTAHINGVFRPAVT